MYPSSTPRSCLYIANWSASRQLGILSLLCSFEIFASFSLSGMSVTFFFGKNRAEKSQFYHDVFVFQKLPPKCFPSALKRQADAFKFLFFEEHFWKASFS